MATHFSAVGWYVGVSEKLGKGTGGLIEAMSDDSKAEIRLGSPVGSIEHAGEVVRVTTRGGEPFFERDIEIFETLLVEGSSPEANAGRGGIDVHDRPLEVEPLLNRDGEWARASVTSKRPGEPLRGWTLDDVHAIAARSRDRRGAGHRGATQVPPPEWWFPYERPDIVIPETKEALA